MKKVLLLAVLLASSLHGKAQELESLLLAGNDVNRLMNSYLDPAVKSALYGLNSGWYSSAKTHQVLGFDVTINVNAAFVPSNDRSFSFLNTDYEFLSVSGGSADFQTVLGSDADNTQVDVTIPVGGNQFRVTSFTMPNGIDIPTLPTPMIQVGLGLPTSTDVKLRLVPSVTASDVKFGLFGAALQHDLMQYFGPLDRLPLNVSLLAGFTTSTAVYDIQDNGVFTGQGQEAEFKLNAFTIQAIGSLDFPVVSVYAGLGYNNGSSTLNMKGTYTLSYDLEDQNGTPQGTVSETVVDPLNLDFEASGFRSTVGARLSLGIFRLFADYTLQEYGTTTAGFAFSFR